ncbi:collagen-like protein [Actinomyces sp.]|uniref:collagen-like triple helix repeat-containing protein n=1 Tax=Actinomyces sp. TaxID=29317 RepID=UPI00291147A9|nr:collagen-like protein [Actinomyces sp.]MDU5232195.1 collagen-like protein [Actinomyces sp.]
MCGWLDVGCKFKEVVGDAVDNAVTQWALAVLESASNALLKLSTAWVGVSVPDLTVSDSTVGFVHDTTHLLVIALAIGSLIVAGIQLAISRKGDGALQILQGLLTLALVSAVSVGTAQLLVEASDEFSVWVLDLAMPEGTEDFAQSILQFGDLSAGLGYVVLIVLGLAAMIATVIQIGLMFIRSSMLILLVGILPLAGAAYFTKWGRAWLWKLIAWFFAFLMFKPAASIIYAVAIKLLTGETWNEVSGDELIRFITGVVMLVLAVLALPALITFMVPATEVLSSGGSGAGVGAGAVLATGAMTVARGAGAAASGGTAAAAGAALDAAQTAHGAANSAVGGGSSSGGEASSPGASGPAGAGGQDGASGTDGAAGPSGASGQDGASGADGSASTPAPSGASDAADTGGGSSGGPSGGQEAQR